MCLVGESPNHPAKQVTVPKPSHEWCRQQRGVAGKIAEIDTTKQLVDAKRRNEAKVLKGQ